MPIFKNFFLPYVFLFPNFILFPLHFSQFSLQKPLHPFLSSKPWIKNRTAKLATTTTLEQMADKIHIVLLNANDV